MRRAALAAGLCVTVAAAAGCESTQEQSARLAKRATAATNAHGIVVRAPNPEVRVRSTAWVRDRYGIAAVVEIQSRSRKAQANLPLSFRITGPGGKRQFANDLPGLDPSLTHVALLRGREHAWWVDDQATASEPRRVVARVGRSAGAVPAKLPRLVPTHLSLEHDPDGTYTRGMLRNRSGIDQRRVTVFGVARRGGKVVAAGRGGIERIKAHGQALFRVFWIGDPKGAHVSLFAPPTILEEG